MSGLKEKLKNLNTEKLISYFSLGLLFLMFIYIFQYQLKLSGYIEWQDESETIVVTKMMAQGARLYIDVYNNHGPLTFIVGLIISFIGDFSISVYRYPVLLLQLLALLSIFFSPIFNQKSLNKVAALVIPSLLWLYFFPYIYGHTYIYQAQSGLLVVIIFSQYLLPVYLDKPLFKFQKIMGPFLIMTLPFFAVTNLPLAILMGISTFKKSDLRLNLLGYLSSLFLILTFIFFFASFKGYYAYHFYMNSLVLNEGKGILGYIETIFNYYRYNFTNLMTLLIILSLNLKLFSHTNKQNVYRSFFILPMLISLVVRGGEAFNLFGLVYLYSITGLSIVLFVDNESSLFKEIFYLILILISLGLFSNNKSIEEDFWAIPLESQFSSIAKRVTSDDEVIQALSFRSFEYLLADRLPASVHFIYLPIQATYNQNPFSDVYSSLLDDLIENEPKLILMDSWTPDIPWVEYATDVNGYILNNYTEIAETDIYYRNDLNLYEYGVDPYTGEITY